MIGLHWRCVCGRPGRGAASPGPPPRPPVASRPGATSNATRRVIHPAGGRYGGGDDDEPEGGAVVEMTSVRRLEFTRVGTAPDRVRGAASGATHRRPKPKE